MDTKDKIHTPEYRSVSVRVSNGSTIQGKVNIAGKEREALEKYNTLLKNKRIISL